MNDDFAVLLFFFGIAVTANIALFAAWLAARRRLRRLENRLVGDGRDDRTARLEEAVASMTVQIDQITSAQEFLSRVITNRMERPGHAVAKRTPS